MLSLEQKKAAEGHMLSSQDMSCFEWQQMKK